MWRCWSCVSERRSSRHHLPPGHNAALVGRVLLECTQRVRSQGVGDERLVILSVPDAIVELVDGAPVSRDVEARHSATFAGVLAEGGNSAHVISTLGWTSRSPAWPSM